VQEEGEQASDLDGAVGRAEARACIAAGESAMISAMAQAARAAKQDDPAGPDGPQATDRSGSSTPAIESTQALIEQAGLPLEPRMEDGYLDLLGERDPVGRRPGQRLMESRGLARIYERLWRPVLGRVLMGPMGPGPRGERRIARNALALSAGERVLDVGCGPGNFTREFARAADGGLVVGIDASRAMLSRAASEPSGENLAYALGDASALPFRDESFDAVCCFAALYLIEEPMRALDEIVRVLVPGGRVALLSSCSRGPLPASVTDAAVRGLSGVRVFGRDELTAALRERGIIGVEQRVSGFAQIVSGRKPER
jgi:SAM-dependent methyltransferase